MPGDNPREGWASAVWRGLADAAGRDGIARVTPEVLRRDIVESVGAIGLDQVFEGLLALHHDGSVESIPPAKGGGYRLNYGSQAARSPAPEWTQIQPEELVRMAARKAKGREKRAAVVDDGSGLVRVKLTDDEWRGRCDDLASALKKREDIQSRKNAGNSKWNAEIRQLDEQISILADEVDTRETNVAAQASMFDATGKPKPGENDAVAEGA